MPTACIKESCNRLLTLGTCVEQSKHLVKFLFYELKRETKLKKKTMSGFVLLVTASDLYVLHQTTLNDNKMFVTLTESC